MEKNLLNSNTSYTRPDNIMNFGLLTAEICWQVWGTPANFTGFCLCVLAALLHGTLVVGVSLTLWHWTEGATCIRQGSHGAGHWPTFQFKLRWMLWTRPSCLHSTDTTVMYTPQIHYRLDRRVHDRRVCAPHDRRKMATHTNQTTTTNQP